MSDSGRLAISVTHTDGRVTRWGPDEPDAIDIPDDLTFSTQIPGGFKDLSCSLLRRIDLEYTDQGLFDDVRVYGPGNRTVWEGRMAQFPRSHGDGFQIVPGAVGWSANLTDDPSFREIYVDRDLGSLGAIPLGRQGAIAGAGISAGAFSFSSQVGDEGGKDITVALGTAALGAQVLSEIWAVYLPKIAKIMYRGKLVSWPGTWVTKLLGSDDPDGVTSLDSYNLTLDDTLRSQALTTAVRRAIAIEVYSNGNAVTPTSGALLSFSKWAAYGNHGLTTRANGTDPDGLYASDVIRDIVTRAAPELTIGQIDSTTFVIPHLVFADATTGEDAIKTVNGFHGFDWDVYDNRTFSWYSSDPDRLCWEARLSSGARLDLEGETAEQIFNGVYVTYTDPAGNRKTVGPPGSTADATDASLADTSTTNPVNQHGITRRWGKFDIPETTTLAGAIQLGAIWLASHALPQRRGTLTLTGTATHPTEGDVPVWRVRAGDYIRISDHPADIPRKIISTQYIHGQRQITLSLDNTPYLLDALLQRFGSGLVGVL